MTTAILREKRLPDGPGIYLMKDDEGKIIYIGKAKSLKKRVTSYFTRQSSNIDWKTSKLVAKIADIEFVVTDNEVEAFLLESNLIKRYRPVFNIELKDQQRYTYLKITHEPFPRLLVARRNRNGKFLGPKGKIYGPFVRGSSKFLTVGLLRKLFKIRICNKLPKVPCLQYFIKNCEAPCIANVTRSDYITNVVMLQKILEGKSSIDRFANEMEREMKRASDIGDYERAKEIRDTLHRLSNLRIRQKMEKAVNRIPDEEYIGLMKDNKKGVAHVMTLPRTRGVISDRKKFEFDLVADNSLSSFIGQYYSSMPIIPRFVYVNEDLNDKQVLEKSLEKLAGHRVNIVNVTHILSKEKYQLMDLISRNLTMYIERGYDAAVIELKNAIKLHTMPEIIDCFDVSNSGTTIAVGSCIRFANNKPAKSFYRKFRIKTVSGQNDPAMIGELVRRRYSSNEKLPDMILVDGGPSQLGAAIASLRSLGIQDIPCISLAKQNEEIYWHGSQEPIMLPKSNVGLKMLQHVRDEAHRFGLAYNVNRRKLR